MPAFLEAKLKSEYGAKSAAPYKIMNKLGYMRGNKETAKGAAAQRKHDKQKGVPLKSLMKVKNGSSKIGY
jgi:hypothetical protein